MTLQLRYAAAILALSCAGLCLRAEPVAQHSGARFGGVFQKADFDVPNIERHPNAISRATVPVPAYDKPTASTGDFDLCFNWYDFSTGVLSDTWQTSMYESIEKVDGDAYVIKNFLREFLNPDPENQDFRMADLHATYDEATSTFTLPGGQYLYRYTEADFEIDLSLIGVKRNAKGGLQPDMELEIKFRWDGTGFALDTSSEVVALFVGAKTANGYGGLGICYAPTLYPWNSTMVYMVTPDFETDPIPYTCNCWASVDGNSLSLSNYADCGYTTQIVFDVNSTFTSAYADNAVLQTVSDLNGNPADVICRDITATGAPSTSNPALSATVSVQGGATMLFQSRWGAFFLDQLVGIYTNTYTIISFDISQPSSYIGDIVGDNAEAPAPEYYTLSGMRVDRPATGIYIVRRGSKITKEIVTR